MDDDADSLHFAICQAVALMNQGDLYGGHDLLRQTLVDFADKKAPLSRSEMVRKQQRSDGGETTAVMVSSSERHCGLCGHSNFNSVIGECDESSDTDDKLFCGCKCVFPATGAGKGAERDHLADDCQRRMDAVVEAAVEWHQSGQEGDNTWFDKSEVLSAAINSLLELRATTPAPSAAGVQENDCLACGGPALDPYCNECAERYAATITPNTAITIDAAREAAREIDDELEIHPPLSKRRLEKIAAIISKHLDSGEAERLRAIEKLYNAGVKAWNPVYETVLNDRDRLRVQLANTRIDIVTEAVDKVSALTVVNERDNRRISSLKFKNRAIAALQSLAEQNEGEDDHRNPAS
jgi:hypothetical protein